MIALIATIQIKPENQKAFMESMLDDARGSNHDEPGCLRFDVLQDSEDPHRIHLYEVYKDQAALDAHRRAPHLIKWRETVKDWFASATVRRVAIPVYPPDSAWKKQPV
jgi:quinol monooxygenase YgiN